MEFLRLIIAAAPIARRRRARGEERGIKDRLVAWRKWG